MFLMVTASQLNDTAISFSPVYPSSSPSFTCGEKNTSSPPPPLLATLFIRLLALIPVKGKFCNAWLLNLISLFLIPHSVIKLMVCVPSASLFTCAYPSFIESSRSLNPGREGCFFGCTVQPPSPTAVSYCKRNCFAPRVWERKKKDRIKQVTVIAFFISIGKKKGGTRENSRVTERCHLCVLL